MYFFFACGKNETAPNRAVCLYALRAVRAKSIGKEWFFLCRK